MAGDHSPAPRRLALTRKDDLACCLLNTVRGRTIGFPCGQGGGDAVFHMGWFVGRGYSVHAWNQPWSGAIGADYMHADLYVDLVRAMERACFDYVMIEDGSFVPDAYKGSPEWYLHNAYTVPKLDPLPLIPLMAQGTRHIGLIATMTTGFYPPYLAARLGATLDHLTGGRVGLNLVTAHNDRTAQNFGLPRHHEHDLRYEMADEWIQVVDRLWRSWEPGAVVADPGSGMFADVGKVRPIDFAGKYYSSRGPLNMPPGPQGRPVVCQAGMSPAGRAFAAKHADTIVAQCRGVDAARRYRDDVRQRMAEHGRDPESCKVMFNTGIVLGESRAEAEEKKARADAALVRNMEYRLARLSFLSGIDFSRFALDEPLPEVKTNASRGQTALMTSGTGHTTLREMLTDPASGGVDFVGTPDSVAAEMGEAAAEVGGDGFMITEGLTRRAIAEITDGLGPALRQRGLIRDGYPHKLFRDNLLAF
jgi:FMN-dependent oxidoreductase (nitrilotriacetate monooxygenase family)